MLTIDVTSIRNHSSELKNLISQYETTSMSLLQEVKNLNTEWHDDNSESFFSLSESQKKEIQRLISDLEDVCSRYDSIADATVAIDASISKVFCDQSYSSVIKNKYDSAISKINGLISRISGSSTYFCTGGERSAINSAKNSLSNAVTKLTNSRNKVEKYFSDLSRLENSIIKIISGININPISELDVTQFLV